MFTINLILPVNFTVFNLNQKKKGVLLLKDLKEYNIKYLISGNVIERYEYEKFQYKGRCNNEFGRGGKEIEGFSKLEQTSDLLELGYTVEEINKIIQEQEKMQNKSKENRIYTLYKDRQKVRRLVNANEDLRTFITLTYKENIQDFDYSNKEFDKALKRINRYLNKHMGKDFKFQYVAVREFQHRGAIHYHMLCNYPLHINDRELHFETALSKMKKNEYQKWFERWWSAKFWDNNGYIDVRSNKITKATYKRHGNKYGEIGDEIDNFGAYMSKYMTKETADNERMEGRKIYLCSQGLKQPIEVIVDEEKEKDILQDVYKLSAISSTINGTYTNDYTGTVNYNQYNLKRNKIVK